MILKEALSNKVSKTSYFLKYLFLRLKTKLIFHLWKPVIFLMTPISKRKQTFKKQLNRNCEFKKNIVNFQNLTTPKP